jgi:hypothetical protein
MKNSLLKIFSAAAIALTMASCSGPNANTGAVLGGLGGAAVGGIIGNQSGRGLEGAAIGGGLGALGGAAVGRGQDQRMYRQQPPPPQYGQPYYGQPQYGQPQYGQPYYR